MAALFHKDRVDSRRGQSDRQRILWRTFSFAFCAIVCVSITGCGGCVWDPLADKKDKKSEDEEFDAKKKKPKDDFDVPLLTTQPSDPTITRNFVKPGHWISAIERMKANNFDFTGELHSTCVNRNGGVIDLERSPYRCNFIRPATLPKGQTKYFETTYYVPRVPGEGRIIRLRNSLTTPTGSRPIIWPDEPTVRLQSDQYYFVVLSRLPDNYGYLKKLDTIDPPRDQWTPEGVGSDYLVLLPQVDQQISLPSNPLSWTLIAYVLWDDFDPDVLTPTQQAALVDWLHWGGQLIVSGPSALELLQASFLAEFLPARPGKIVSVSEDALAALKNEWSAKPILRKSDKVPQRIELIPRDDARVVPRTGEMVVERRMGRGRIVVTSFSLTDRTFINDWDGFDQFFHACVLRRLPRVFRRGTTNGSPEMTWTDYDNLNRDARLVSGLRYFARDVSLSARARSDASASTKGSAACDSLFEVEGYRSDADSGVAGWSDFSGVAEAARQSLNAAAGISVPEGAFVLRILSVYLLVLVPVNWGFFRLLGRVELAWVAAPLIAVVGAVAVVYLAQLDIGFVRSRTEISVVELQGAHPRAHVTRYSGMYSSLSTYYELVFDDATAMCQPFSLNPDDVRLSQQSPMVVNFRKDKQVRLDGLFVRSNTTAMVHSEQMHTLNGTIELSASESDSWRVVNNSPFHLRDVGVVRRTQEGDVQVAVVESLKSMSSVLVRFSGEENYEALYRQWEKNPTTAQATPEGAIGLRMVLSSGLDPLRLNRGDVRLAGWSDQEVPGLSVHPRASQDRFRTVVVANLRYGQLSAPRNDRNTHAEIKEKLQMNFSSSPPGVGHPIRRPAIRVAKSAQSPAPREG